MTIPPGFRIVVIVLLAILAHFAVQGLKRLSRWMLTLKLGAPKFATVTTILVSGLTFVIYFMARRFMFPTAISL
jgi:hypothetical protein